jgi:hypothetical protein
MAEFANQLQAWAQGDAQRDDRAAEAIRQRYVASLGEQLGNSVDPEAFARAETEFRDAVASARQRSADRQRHLLRESMQQGEQSRREFIEEYGVKAALDLNDSPWIGSLRDGEDFVNAALSRDPDQRQGELYRARQILWGRPLWWMHSVALIGSLRLRGEDGCDPLATEMATQGIRDHLLEFADDPRLAASWRLQRAFIPATARMAAFAPLEQQTRSIADRLSAEDRIRYRLTPGRLMMNLVTTVVQRRLRELDWTAEALGAAAAEAESALRSIPIPPAAWDGPLGDPWLQTWSQYSPLVMCGLAILSSEPSGDDLLGRPELATVVDGAARSEFEPMRRPAIALAERLGLISDSGGAPAVS